MYNRALKFSHIPPQALSIAYEINRRRKTILVLFCQQLTISKLRFHGDVPLINIQQYE